MAHEPNIVRHDASGDVEMTLIERRELDRLLNALELGRVVATKAETTGGQEIEFDGSIYQAVEPELLDDLADAGTQFMLAVGRLKSTGGKQ